MGLDQAATLILLGRNLEARAKGRASEAVFKLLERGAMLAMAASLPKSACASRRSGGPSRHAFVPGGDHRIPTNRIAWETRREWSTT
jgi:hypothetical protein